MPKRPNYREAIAWAYQFVGARMQEGDYVQVLDNLSA